LISYLSSTAVVLPLIDDLWDDIDRTVESIVVWMGEGEKRIA
jgi:hypothetical protein